MIKFDYSSNKLVAKKCAVNTKFDGTMIQHRTKNTLSTWYSIRACSIVDLCHTLLVDEKCVRAISPQFPAIAVALSCKDNNPLRKLD